MGIITEKQWFETVEPIKNCSLLQTSEWGNLKREFGWTPEYLKTEAAGALILFKKLPKWLLGATIAYIPRGPVLLDADAKKLALFWEEVHKRCHSRKALFLRVEPDTWEDSAEADLLLNSMKGFRPAFSTIQPPKTIVIPLKGEGDGWLARMNQKTRYNIRLSQKKDLTVEENGSVETFSQLMDLTGERNEFGVHSDAYYKRCYELFSAEGKAYNLIARYQGKPLAGLMLFIQGKRGYYLYGASSNEERNRMPNHLLQWTAMQLCEEKGCDEYDLWGIPDESLETLESQFSVRHDGLWPVYRFKRGFGGEVRRTSGSFDFAYLPPLYWLIAKYFKKHKNGI